ncbi:helix-turn-helix domain-containing protein [Gemelliphila palaticanis]|uniref:Helix-turn-helix transcriptional regulator n=1 Tax=Gemelliphila palaticanis TaxID=81950 RepID=A0ABX2SXQ2_9BACL|nr:helix-turn-helix transcriptional regulator [Gemella palaticanis]MBF0714979.1 helix-turn-helix transcriptional regulator [Gemella palaticanis]NYS46909.1 helix-turn-helix transcriptional regulator [Gemella palaticanis]
MNIGSRIKELRLKNNLTLEELGKKTNISRQNLHKYEQGIISNIPKEKIETIARALNTSPSYLYGWETNNIDINPEILEITKAITENEDLKNLFIQVKNASKKDIEIATNLLLNLKNY